MTRPPALALWGLLALALAAPGSATADAGGEAVDDGEAAAYGEEEGGSGLSLGSAGAVAGLALLGDRDVGGGLVVDQQWSLGPLRFGVGGGVAALTGDNDDRTRTFMPIGLSLAFGGNLGPVALSLRARGGLWAGATNFGLRVGGLLTGGGYFEVRLDDEVSLGAGVEAWGMWGHGKRFLWAPTLVLSWNLDGSD